MRKIKVLHRAATTGVGGVEKYVLNNYKYMDRDKYQFDFITRNPLLGEMKEIQELNIGIKTFTATENTNKELLIKEINEILDEGYDVIHMNTSCWAGFLIEELAIQRNIPKIIVHSHSTGVDMPSPEKLKLQLERHEYFKSRFNKTYATDLCACSKNAADWLFGSHIPREDIKILKNAIEVEKYSFNQLVRNEVRNNLGLDGCFVIGHIGRFSYAKNHQFLIEVFHNIYAKNSKARLILVGQGEYEADIKKQVQEYELQDVVLFLGWREDVGDLMQGMDLFLLPSRFEGFPVSLIEAQASGVTCIVSDFVTDEVKITDNLEFLPLEVDAWTNKIADCADGYERENMDKVITAAGYNIKYAVKELEALYTGGGYIEPLISVIVPIYKVEKYLSQCIESIMKQTYRNLEIILVDDGSPDQSPQICDEYSCKDKRIRVIHKDNGGLVSARRAGVEQAAGDYVTFVDGDDWIDESAYEFMIQRKDDKIPDIITSVLYLKDYAGGQVISSQSNMPEGYYTNIEYDETIFPNLICTDVFFDTNISTTLCTSLYKRDLLTFVYSKMSDRISIGEDAICLWTCCFYSNSIQTKRKAYYHYRQHPKSMMHTASVKDLESLAYLYHELKKVINDANQYNINWRKRLDYYMYFVMFMTNYQQFSKIKPGYLFPYTKVKQGSRIILYGSGVFGTQIKKCMDVNDDFKIVKWVDKDYLRFKGSDNLIESPESIPDVLYDFVVVAVTRDSAAQQIKNELIIMGVSSEKIALVDKDVLTHHNLYTALLDI